MWKLKGFFQLKILKGIPFMSKALHFTQAISSSCTEGNNIWNWMIKWFNNHPSMCYGSPPLKEKMDLD